MAPHTSRASLDAASAPLSFSFTTSTPKLLDSNVAASSAFDISTHLGRIRPCRRTRMHVPFASVSLSGAQKATTETRKMPVFVIASAVEAKKADAASNSWRFAAGNLAAGATAGCAVEAALYPIDTIKTRLQAMVGGGGFKAMMQAGGGKALYAGVWGNLAGVIPSSAIFMAVYEHTKKLSIEAGQHDMAGAIAGAAAGAVASITRVPTEVIKQRLQTKEFAGAIPAIRHIVAKEGFRGLYAGYGAFMLRDVPFDAIQFVVYERAKTAWTKYKGAELNTGETSIIGAFAGGFTGVITTPLDVLKTRLMTQGSSGRYKNILDATIQIARTEGIGAFMSGWQPRLIWISLGGTVFFAALENAKKVFNPPATA